ncbi:MAG: DUF1800 domain-containing protein [Candidatus Eremiobacteraeota bacterium]|nr:DUF1800 domain-containing protein [Candidatus Eremiobacteraeota bacterium]
MTRPPGRIDPATALHPYRGPWNERLAAHLSRRAGFGATADDARRLASVSVHAAVESFIHFASDADLPAPENVYDPRQTYAAAYMGGAMRRPDDMTRRQMFQEIQKSERESVLSMQHWWLNRMLNSPAPLREKMTFYFHNHFTSAAVQKQVFPTMIYAQNELFRQNALGNLRDLTWKISIDPAMLRYLDNAQNQAAHPNENYARELMELFTLGVGNYTEEDIRQSARAWTGWTVDRRTSEAYFNARMHDDGVKKFLGQTGNFGGQDIVNIIFTQPAAAKFFATSLLNFFVYNDPEPALVDAFAAVIRKNNFNLAPVLSVLFNSNVFFSDRAYRALVKSPVEFVIGTYKAFGMKEADPSAQRALAQMGQILFYPPNVAGWPGGSNWLTSQMMIARQNFVAGLVNSPMMADVSWLQNVPVKAASAAQTLVRTILYGDASPKGMLQLADYLNGINTSALGMLSGENYDERVRGAAYLTMAMPAYQLN